VSTVPEIVTRDEVTTLPGGYALPGGSDMNVACISATFDGSGAGGQFLACCSIFSQTGHLIGRFPAPQVFAAGDSGEVTFAPLAEAAPSSAPVSSAVAMWPMFYEVLPWDLWNNLDGVAAPFFGNDLLTPDMAGANAYVNGWRFGDTRDQASFLVPLRLGPQGSVWSIEFIADGGPNAGVVEYHWQTISESVPGQGYDLNGLNILGDSVTRGGPPDPLVYYRTSAAYAFDAYGAAPFTNRQVIGYSQFRIMGADGAAITGNGVPSGADGVDHFTGGAGIWVLKVQTNGKNGASGGYQTRLSSIIVRRISISGFYAG